MLKLLPIILLSFVLASCKGGSSSSTPVLDVKTVTPETGATGIDAYSQVKLKMTLDIDEASLNYVDADGMLTSRFQLVNLSTSLSVPGTVEYDSLFNEIVFTPSAPLAWSIEGAPTEYQVSLKSGVTASDGKYPMANDYFSTFTTAERPTPQVSSISHTGVEANSVKPIVMVFNFEPDETNLNNSYVKVTNTTDGQDVPGSLSVNKTARSITFTPNSGYLAYNSSFTVTLTNSIGGYSGLDYISLDPTAFGTKSFSTPGPMVMSYSPTGSNVHPSPLSNKTVKLNVSLNFTVNSVGGNIYLTDFLSDRRVPLRVVSTLPSSSLTLETTEALEYDSLYEVTISTGLSASFNGNVRLPADFSWTFLTQEMKILSISQTSGSFDVGDNFVIETNFDLSTQSELELSESFSVSNPQTANGTIKFEGRTLSITSAQTNDWRYGQDIDGYYALYATDGTFVTDGDIDLFINDFEVLPANKVPYNGQSSVDPNVIISFDYTELEIPDDQAIAIEFDPSSLINVVNCFGATVFGDIEVAVGSSEKDVSFIPDFPLEPGCRHTVYINEGVALNGENIVSGETSWSFTTDSFEVESVSVSSFAGLVDIDSDITVNFSDSVDYYNSSNIYIVDNFTGFEVLASVYRFSDTITVDPISNLSYDRSYTLVVEYDAVENDNGVTLKFDYEYDFITEDEPFIPVADDFYVDGVSATTYLGGVEVDSDITVNFSESVFVNDSSGIYLEDDFGSVVFATVITLFDSVIIDPFSLLDYDSFYTVVVEYDAVESSSFGVMLDNDYEYLFLTEEDPFFFASASQAMTRKVRSSALVSPKAYKVPAQPVMLNKKDQRPVKSAKTVFSVAQLESMTLPTASTGYQTKRKAKSKTAEKVNKRNGKAVVEIPVNAE